MANAGTSYQQSGITNRESISKTGNESRETDD